MNKTVSIVVGVVVVIAVIAGVVVATRKKTTTSTSTTPSPASSSTSPTTSPTASQPSANGNQVTINGFAFSPATLTVKKGTQVTWTNQDSTAHTVTADSGSGPASQTLNQGATYSFTFDTVGTFAYHCSFHSDMHGSVVVTE